MKTNWEAILLIMALAFVGLNAHAQNGSDVVRLSPALDTIVPLKAHLEKLAGGFGFLEGPVWIRQDSEGYLLFSDIPANVIDKWTPEGKVSVFLDKSGFTGTDASDVGMEINNGYKVVTLIGSNAITLDRQGRIVFCQHGNRAIVRLEKNGERTVLASQYDGKRLNSPNDLVYKSDGSL
ncbi:MAG: SMP-30/gluconolactonase/LRE family protein, partial [Terriglobia bacterium]